MRKLLVALVLVNIAAVTYIAAGLVGGTETRYLGGVSYKRAVSWCEDEGGRLSGDERADEFAREAMQGRIDEPALKSAMLLKESGEDVSVAVLFVDLDNHAVRLVNPRTGYDTTLVQHVEPKAFAAALELELFHECVVPL